jgi:hypothetical protein
MHSVPFVFDGNVITITFHLCALARAVPGMPLDWARAANPNLHRLQRPCQQGLAPDFRLLQALEAGRLVFLHSMIAFRAECTAS